MSEPTKDYLREHHAAQDRATDDRTCSPLKYAADADRASLHKHSERAATLDRGRDAMPVNARELRVAQLRRDIEYGDLDAFLAQLETSIQFRRARLHCADL